MVNNDSTYFAYQGLCTAAEQRTVHPGIALVFFRSQRNSHQHAAETSTNQQCACLLNVDQPDPRRRRRGVQVGRLYSGSTNITNHFCKTICETGCVLMSRTSHIQRHPEALTVGYLS